MVNLLGGWTDYLYLGYLGNYISRVKLSAFLLQLRFKSLLHSTSLLDFIVSLLKTYISLYSLGIC